MINRKDTTSLQPESDNFDIQAAIRRVRSAVFSNLLLIAVCIVATMALVITYSRLFPEIYAAEVVLLAEAPDDPENNYYSVWNLFRKIDIDTEPELITSRLVVRRTVEDLGLTFDDVYHTHLTQLAWLWKQSWPGQAYTAVKEFLFPPPKTEFTPTPEQIDRVRTIESFRHGISLEVVPDTTVARLLVLGPTPRVFQYANHLVDVYLEERRDLAVTEATNAYDTLMVEVERAAADLAEVEQARLQFEQQNTLALEFEKDKILIAKWTEMRNSASELEAQIASLEAGLEVVEEQLANEAPEVIQGRTFQNSSLRDSVEVRRFELESQLNQARELYQPGAPEITEIRKLLDSVEAELESLPEKGELARSGTMNPLYESLRKRRADLVAQLASSRAAFRERSRTLQELTQRIEGLPALFQRAREFARESEHLQSRHNLLKERLMMADVSRATARSAPATVKVLERAQPPTKRAWPDMRLLLIAAVIFGSAVGVGLALVIELLSTTITRDRLAGRPDLPIYATVQLRSAPEPPPVLPDAGGALPRLGGA